MVCGPLNTHMDIYLGKLGYVSNSESVNIKHQLLSAILIGIKITLFTWTTNKEAKTLNSGRKILLSQTCHFVVVVIVVFHFFNYHSLNNRDKESQKK